MIRAAASTGAMIGIRSNTHADQPHPNIRRASFMRSVDVQPTFSRR
jgi:hypothetical protein